MAKRKAKAKALQVWKFTPSQTALLKEQARHHAEELKPFTQYQAVAQSELLYTFLEELGIDKDAPLTVDLKNLQFVERVVPQIPAPQGPVEVLDPGKTTKK